jgi:hypothetical protein
MNGVKRIAIVATFSLLIATGRTAQNAVTQWNSMAISEARSSATANAVWPAVQCIGSSSTTNAILYTLTAWGLPTARCSCLSRASCHDSCLRNKNWAFVRR